MATDCDINKSNGPIAFAESMCSDGMCCFTCVIPANNGHVGLLRFFWKRGTGSPYVKLLVTSKGRKDEVYNSCKFLNFFGTINALNASLTMDLRCGIYKWRPYQCMGYPDLAGESPDYKISGPCLFNEYTAGSRYQQLVYRREWHAFYAIQDQAKAFLNVFPGENVQSARETLLKITGVRKATIPMGKKGLDYILIPIPKKTKNVLYLSGDHEPITTIRQAYCCWEEKIQKNLRNHYGKEWKTQLENAIEMEENDARKRSDEDTARNTEC